MLNPLFYHFIILMERNWFEKCHNFPKGKAEHLQMTLLHQVWERTLLIDKCIKPVLFVQGQVSLFELLKPVCYSLKMASQILYTERNSICCACFKHMCFHYIHSDSRKLVYVSIACCLVAAHLHSLSYVSYKLWYFPVYIYISLKL